jgi:hypothetical protein
VGGDWERVDWMKSGPKSVRRKKRRKKKVDIGLLRLETFILWRKNEEKRRKNQKSRKKGVNDRQWECQ